MTKTAFRSARKSTSRVTYAGTLVLMISLAGCASIRDSRANPFNWFGSSTAVPRTAEVDENTNPLIPDSRASIFRNDDEDVYRGTFVAEVSELAVERVPGGAVIRATGIANGFGAFHARLVAVDTEDPALLRYEFRALQPDRSGQGSPAARSVTVAVRLSDQTLRSVRRIQVVGAENERSVRR